MKENFTHPETLVFSGR